MNVGAECDGAEFLGAECVGAECNHNTSVL